MPPTHKLLQLVPWPRPGLEPLGLEQPAQQPQTRLVEQEERVVLGERLEDELLEQQEPLVQAVPES